MTAIITAREKIAAAAALLLGTVLYGAGGAIAQEPEQTDIELGITLSTATFLPIYVAEQEGYFDDEGLTVNITGFRGGSDLTRALIADGVDIAVASPAGVIGAIQAGQDVKVFYGGFNQVPFAWYAAPSIKSTEDLKGKVIGITRYGSSTDVLTRMVLAKAGLDPDKDVRIMQGGGSSERLAALEAGQIDAGPFASPHNFMAADRGFSLIAQQSDFMPDYPVQSFFSTIGYIENHPETIRRVLRAFVRGIRFSKENKEAAVQILVDRVGLEEAYAGRVYDEMMNGFQEDGRLGSEEGLKAFIEMGIASGEFQKAWPLEAYWVDTFHSTFNEWKPE